MKKTNQKNLLKDELKFEDMSEDVQKDLDELSEIIAHFILNEIKKENLIDKNGGKLRPNSKV